MQFAMITKYEYEQLNKLTHADAMVFLGIKMYSDYSKGIYKNGYGLISSYTGIAKQNVYRAFKNLEAAGLVSCLSHVSEDQRRKEWKINTSQPDEVVINADYQSNEIVITDDYYPQKEVINPDYYDEKVVITGDYQNENSNHHRLQKVITTDYPIQKAEYKPASRLDVVVMNQVKFAIDSLAPNPQTQQQVYDVLEANADVTDENVLSFVRDKVKKAKTLKGLLMFLADTPDKPLPNVEPFVYTPIEKAPKEVIDQCMSKVRERLQAKQMA